MQADGPRWPSTNTRDPLGCRTWPAALHGLSKQAVIKAVCDFQLESNRDGANQLTDSALRAGGDSREPGCAGSETARFLDRDMVFLEEKRSQETFLSSMLVANGSRAPCWQGRRGSYGPTRFVCCCHTVLLMCTRDASFGAQLDEEESWIGMIAIMQHPLSSKSGATRPLTAPLRAAQRSQALSQLTAYHSGTTDPMELANGHETRSR